MYVYIKFLNIICNTQQWFEFKARVVNFELGENDIVMQHGMADLFVYCKFACRQTPFAEINILHPTY